MANEVTTVPYPFVRCKATVFDGEGSSQIDSWRPGVEDWMPNAYEEGKYADGVGTMTLTLVSAHKPGKYQERVFYVRQFTTPDGVTFGKTALRMTTRLAYERLCKGYRYPYTVDDAERPMTTPTNREQAR